jgi:hypothetical protein
MLERLAPGPAAAEFGFEMLKLMFSGCYFNGKGDVLFSLARGQ